MAFGLTICLLVVSVRGCVGNNNNTAWNNKKPSSTTLHGLSRSASVTLVRPSTLSNFMNTSTLLLPTTTSLLHSHVDLNLSVVPSVGSSLVSSVISSEGSPLVSSVQLSSLTQTSIPTVDGKTKRNFMSGSILTPSSSALLRVSNKNTSFDGSSVWPNSSFGLKASSRTQMINHHKSSSVQLISSNVVPLQGPNKIFVVEIVIQNINFSSEHQNLSSSVFKNTSSKITTSIDSVMKSAKNYRGCKVVEISCYATFDAKLLETLPRCSLAILNKRLPFSSDIVMSKSITSFPVNASPSSRKVRLEITMGPDSSSDPKTSLANLRTAVLSRRIGFLIVDPNDFTAWLKEDPPERERLLPGQLAGVALILFILVVLLLIICLGNFADEPVFNERELFTEEISMENVEGVKDTQGQQEDEEWKFDPLFAWSPRKSFDSKL